MHFRYGLLVTFVSLMFFPFQSFADVDEIKNQTPANSTTVSVGYRGVSEDDNPGRAKEYDSLESSPTLDLEYSGESEGKHFHLGISYLNDQDYTIEGEANLKSQLKFDVLSERFYHNLDHIPFNRDDGVYYNSAGTESFTRVDFNDANPNADYGIQLDLTEVSAQGKLPSYPAHVNLKYWRWEKEGRRQLRYMNEGCATNCHVNSRNRSVDTVTEEVSGSIDAHLGFIDLVFEQLFRTFDNKEPTPIDSFEGHYLLAPYASGPPQFADYQHDDNPDLSYRESTFKINSTLGGGFVANASYSIAKRKNKSDSVSNVRPIYAETDINKFATDLRYITSARWAFNARYRLLDLDSDNNDTITSDGLSYFDSGTGQSDKTQPIEVRQSMDIQRDFYEAWLAYRPSQKSSIKAKFQLEDIERSNTNGPVAHSGGPVGSPDITIDPYWELPGHEQISKLKLSYASRYFDKNQLKVKAWWEYQDIDNPAYNISLESAHSLFLSTTYTPSSVWGATGSLRYRTGENNGYTHTQFDDNDTLISYNQDRDEKLTNASLGLWFNPAPGLSFDVNYGYLRTRIVQDLLFGAEPDSSDPGGQTDFTIEDDDTEYRQSVHTLSMGTSWQIIEPLSCRLEAYHIRSKARYSPDFPTELSLYDAGDHLAEASSDELSEISRIDIRQNGIKGRINWSIDDNWSCALEATYDKYDDRNSNDFDGSVQTAMISFSRAW